MKGWCEHRDGPEKYRLYLASREWASIKAAVRERSGGRCERCAAAPARDVHHLTYARKYAERLDDLLHVCGPCHEFLSGRRAEGPMSVRTRREPVDSPPRAYAMKVGCSSYTATKWERLEYLINTHVRICKLVIEKWSWLSPIYHYFDFYAGPGIYGQAEHPELVNQWGSPLRALKIIDDHLSRFAFLFDPSYTGRLELSLSIAGIVGAHVGALTCPEAVDFLRDDSLWSRFPPDDKGRIGLAFFDPNGPPDWDAIERFTSHWRFEKIDILVNINAANCKWCYVSKTNPESMRPTEHLSRLRKKSIYLWNPNPGDSNQFTLAYCTNGPIDQFKRLGFWRMDSEKGQAIARRIDYSARERKAPSPSDFLMGLEWM